MCVVVCVFVFFFFEGDGDHRELHSFPTRRSSDLGNIHHLKDGWWTGTSGAGGRWI